VVLLRWSEKQHRDWWPVGRYFREPVPGPPVVVCACPTVRLGLGQFDSQPLVGLADAAIPGTAPKSKCAPCPALPAVARRRGWLEITTSSVKAGAKDEEPGSAFGLKFTSCCKHLHLPSRNDITADRRTWSQREEHLRQRQLRSRTTLSQAPLLSV
jgi:hypothetical protein